MLVDTSVWVEHLRRRHRGLAALLEEGGVHTHPFVIGELACGRLHDRSTILALLSELPCAPRAGDDEALLFVEHFDLAGQGLGWIDVHLLASARMGGLPLLTLDRRLAREARRLGIDASD